MNACDEIKAQTGPINQTLNSLKIDIFDQYAKDLNTVDPIPSIKLLVGRFDQVKNVTDHNETLGSDVKLAVDSVVYGLRNLTGTPPFNKKIDKNDLQKC